MIFNILWAFYRTVDPFSFLLGRLGRIFTHAMVDWLVKAINAAFVFIGAATVLEVWGIEVGPLIVGLGLFGVAVALGAQDLFKNLIAGIIIIAEKRFASGDWIKVYGVVEGTVESIGFRCTRIRDEIEAYVLDSPELAKPPEVATFVRIDRFIDSSIDIMLYCFTKTINWGD